MERDPLGEKNIFDYYLAQKITWGEAWNMIVGEVLKQTDGYFSLSPQDGELMPLHNNLVVGPGLREQFKPLVDQAKKLLNELDRGTN